MADTNDKPAADAAAANAVDAGAPAGPPGRPRMAAPVAAGAVAAAILLALLSLLLIARCQVKGMISEMFADEPLAIAAYSPAGAAARISGERQKLVGAAAAGASVELSAESIALLVAGRVFDLPAKPARAGVAVRLVQPARLALEVSLPLSRTAGKHLNMRVTLRFVNDQEGVKAAYEAYEVGKLRLDEALRLQLELPLAEAASVFDAWLTPAPRRIEILEDRVRLHYGAAAQPPAGT